MLNISVASLYDKFGLLSQVRKMATNGIAKWPRSTTHSQRMLPRAICENFYYILNCSCHIVFRSQRLNYYVLPSSDSGIFDNVYDYTCVLLKMDYQHNLFKLCKYYVVVIAIPFPGYPESRNYGIFNLGRFRTFWQSRIPGLAASRDYGITKKSFKWYFFSVQMIK